MTLRHLDPTSIAAPIGKFAHVVTTPPGSALAFVSGQIGARPDGAIVEGGATEQARQAFANFAAILAELGAGPADVVKMLTFVVGDEGFAGFARARDETFAEWYPDGRFPAHSAAVVTKLATAELLVEFEAVVTLKS